jgi:hypothetical protein
LIQGDEADSETNILEVMVYYGFGNNFLFALNLKTGKIESEEKFYFPGSINVNHGDSNAY